MTNPIEATRRATWIELSYETPLTPCTGITAVVRQQIEKFPAGGVIIAPFHGRLEATQAALGSGEIVDTGLRVTAFAPRAVPVQVLMHITKSGVVIVYLAAEGFFQGEPTPYDTPAIEADVLAFGACVDAFFATVWTEELDCQQLPWVVGTDWLAVPALHRLRHRHVILLELHNVFDATVGPLASDYGDEYADFKLLGRTVLQVGLETSDVVTTVSDGFARGLARDPIHTRLLAQHLQTDMWRVVGIDNGPFLPSTADLRLLLAQAASDFEAGLRGLHERKAAARRKLPFEVPEESVLLVVMGRRCAQKLHETAVEALAQLLDKGLPIFAVFATTAGSPGHEQRLACIEALANRYPAQVRSFDGRLLFFDSLMAAADLNVMPSLWEPHGGAFSGTVLPLARAVDGLASQIVPLDGVGAHGTRPSGFLFRECDIDDADQRDADLAALLSECPAPRNETFMRIAAALAAEIDHAVRLARDRPRLFAEMILGALEKQETWSWQQNFAAHEALAKHARAQRRQKVLCLKDPKKAAA